MILFDLDGTLLTDNICPEQASALCWAAHETFGVVGEAVPLDWVGKTDLQLAAEMADYGGVPFDAKTFSFNFVARFMATCEGDLSDRVRPGMVEVLRACHDAGWTCRVVTGNLRVIAEAKLERAGLLRWFDLERGGYGSDAVSRVEVVEAALDRGRAVALIGDTHRDVLAAKANGLRAFGLVTEKHGPEELAKADRVGEPEDIVAWLEWDAMEVA